MGWSFIEWIGVGFGVYFVLQGLQVGNQLVQLLFQRGDPCAVSNQLVVQFGDQLFLEAGLHFQLIDAFVLCHALL